MSTTIRELARGHRQRSLLVRAARTRVPYPAIEPVVGADVEPDQIETTPLSEAQLRNLRTVVQWVGDNYHVPNGRKGGGKSHRRGYSSATVDATVGLISEALGELTPCPICSRGLLPHAPAASWMHNGRRSLAHERCVDRLLDA